MTTWDFINVNLFDSSKFTVPVSIKKIDQQPNRHPGKKPFPANRWYFYQQIKTRQYSHYRDQRIFSHKRKDRKYPGDY